jgi:DNA-binding NtrC family response regulator
VVLMDLATPGIPGLELFSRIRTLSPEADVIVLTDAPRVAVAYEALRQGAHDFLVHPIDNEQLGVAIHRLRTTRTLRREVELLRNGATSSHANGDGGSNGTNGSNGEHPIPTLGEAERDLLIRAMAKAGGIKRRAADILDVERRRLYRMLKRHNL